MGLEAPATQRRLLWFRGSAGHSALLGFGRYEDGRHGHSPLPCLAVARPLLALSLLLALALLLTTLTLHSLVAQLALTTSIIFYPALRLAVSFFHGQVLVPRHEEDRRQRPDGTKTNHD